MKVDRFELKERKGTKSIKPRIDRRVQRRIDHKVKTKVDKTDLGGLVSLYKEVTNPKSRRQLRDDVQVKKTFEKINSKFNKDFNNLRRRNPSLLKERPQFELTIKRKRLRKKIERYYVSAGAAEGGNGTQEQPYRTINQALERAQELGHWVLYIYIENGVYTENLEITRQTHLLGDYSILEGTIENSNHHLTIDEINIRNAVGRGIHQVGGTLIVDKCSIIGTSRVAGDPESGTAIHLSGGAEALLEHISLDENEGRALFVTGSGTKAEVRNAWITFNSLDPMTVHEYISSDSCIGAVEVTNGALLLMEHFLVGQNDICGVLAHNNGSAHLRHFLVSTTKRIEVAGHNYVGTNVLSFQNSTIEMHNFLSMDATVGLFALEAYLTATVGTVRNNEWGFYYQKCPEDYEWEDCIDVIFENNETTIQGDVLSVPNEASPIPSIGGNPEDTPEPEEPPEPECPKVNWD